ncbi:MAG: hypothetical protein ACYC1K_02885 [Minisyncoccota bacterium]
MNNDSNKIIQDQLNSLPLDVRESISRVPWKNKIKDIAKREGLDEEKSTTLETETMFILFGFLSFDTYTENIIREIGLNEETANRISDSVYNEIVLEIQKQFEMIEAISHKEIPKMEIPTQPKITEPKIETPAITPTPKTTTIEIPPANLPMIEPGEVVHDTKPQTAPPVVETKPTIPQPVQKSSIPVPPKPANSHYPDGQDPYREPLI